MALAHSRLTAQGQIWVPAEVRRKLGVDPGALLEWEEEGDNIVVRGLGRDGFADIIGRSSAANGQSATRSRS